METAKTPPSSSLHPRASAESSYLADIGRWLSGVLQVLTPLIMFGLFVFMKDKFRGVQSQLDRIPTKAEITNQTIILYLQQRTEREAELESFSKRIDEIGRSYEGLQIPAIMRPENAAQNASESESTHSPAHKSENSAPRPR